MTYCNIFVVHNLMPATALFYQLRARSQWMLASSPRRHLQAAPR